MSSTKRGSTRSTDDAYMTPPWAVRAILSRILEPTHERVLDPCCGDGGLLATASTWAARHGETGVCKTILGIELRETPEEDMFIPAASYVFCDSLLLEAREWKCDLLLTNPPYSRAMEFVARAVSLRKLCFIDTVAMLLRLPWLAGQKRFAFHRDNPCDVYVLAKRPSFTGGRTTDSCDYAWFVWGPGRGGHYEVMGDGIEKEDGDDA